MILEALFSFPMSFFCDPGQIRPGSVGGLPVVLVLFVLIELYKFMLTFEKFVWGPWTCQGSSLPFQSTDAMFGVIAGYGWGCSSIVPFCRVGGGISTETAAVGAALSALNEYRVEEDDSAFLRASPTSWTTLLVSSLVWGSFSSARLLTLCAWRWFSLHPRMRWVILGKLRDVPCSSLSWKRGGYFESRSPYSALQSAR